MAAKNTMVSQSISRTISTLRRLPIRIGTHAIRAIYVITSYSIHYTKLYDILEKAEKEADVIVWDGGNNDFAFYKPDLQIVVADPHRPGHEATYHPGETNIRVADVVVMNKISYNFV